MREMRDSGIPWIGEIPEGWSSIKLLYVLRAHITDGPHETPNLIDEGIPFISIDSLNDSDTIDFSNVRKFISYDDYLRYNIKSNIEKDDILFTKAATIGKTAIVKDEIFMVWSPLAIIKANHSIVCNKYLYHILNTDNLIKDVILHGSNNTQINVGMRELEAAIIPFPPLAEQQRIAEFLDRKCAEVDEMIALQEQIIEELKAYKQSVITEAVTKGLNPAAPMCDSGIEWIGQIPEHWKCGQFWRLNYIRGRLGWKGLKAEEYQEFGYPFLSAFNIINDKLDWNEINRITQERYDESPEIKLSKGDLLIVKDGAGMGKCARIDNLPLGEATVNSSLAVITPNEHLNYKFEYYYFLSAPFQSVIWLLKIGMGVPHLTQENMRSISMVHPSITEQQAIADYLDEKCADIDNLIQSKQEKIDSLKEYKRSIIYEYVTGKKEVV